MGDVNRGVPAPGRPGHTHTPCSGSHLTRSGFWCGLLSTEPSGGKGQTLRFSLFSTQFWGVFLILVGSAAILRTYGIINIPLLRLAIALLFIWAGLVVIVGREPILQTDPDTILFDPDGRTVSAKSGEFNSIFSSAIIKVDEPYNDEGHVLEINAIFGTSTVHVPRGVPLKVSASTVFGSATTPGGTIQVIGDRVYVSPGYSEESRFIRIEANAIFGSVRVLLDDTSADQEDSLG